MVCEDCAKVEQVQLEVVTLRSELSTMKEHMQHMLSLLASFMKRATPLNAVSRRADAAAAADDVITNGKGHKMASTTAKEAHVESDEEINKFRQSLRAQKRSREIAPEADSATPGSKKRKKAQGTGCVSCCVRGCTSKRPGDRRISFHRFPTDLARCRKWVKAFKDPEMVPDHRKRVCARHFVRDCFEVKKIYGHMRRCLKPSAVPSRFPHNRWGKEDGQEGERSAVESEDEWSGLSSVKDVTSSESEAENDVSVKKKPKKCHYYRCSIPGCKSVISSTNLVDGTPVSFHRFPMDPIQRSDWLTMIGIEDWEPDTNHRVCSLHFMPGLIEKVRLNTSTGIGWRSVLVKGAVPTKFPRPGEAWPPPLTEEKPRYRDLPLVLNDLDAPSNLNLDGALAAFGSTFYDDDEGDSDDSDLSSESESDAWPAGSSGHRGVLPKFFNSAGEVGEFCVVSGCVSNPEVSTLFPFPPPGPLRQAWLAAIGQRHLVPQNFTRVCLDHFAPDDLEYDANRDAYLLQEGAIPTIDVEPQSDIIPGVSVDAKVKIVEPGEVVGETGKVYYYDADEEGDVAEVEATAAPGIFYAESKALVEQEDEEEDD